MNEQRTNTRLAIQLDATVISFSGENFFATTRNISFSGMRISPVSDIDLIAGDECRVVLSLSGSEITIDFSCKTIYNGLNGIGLEYLAVNGVESYGHFENLLLANSADPESLLLQCDLHPGIIGAAH